jgi:NAD-dependent deacetylase
MEDIEKLAGLLKSSRRIVAFTGAGVSTESDIPDFRSSGGVYESIQKAYGRPPEELLSHGFFEAHPEIFFDYLRKYLVFPDALPNMAHKTLAALENGGRLTCVVTQNIDGLHSKAGSKNVCELHGSIYRNYCVKCGRRYELQYTLAAEGVPRCEACGGVIRPDVVLYGEQLDESVLERAVGEIERAQLMLVMGTSLAVYPAAGLLNYFRGGELVLINKSPTPYDGRASLVINAQAGRAMQEAARLIGLEVS